MRQRGGADAAVLAELKLRSARLIGMMEDGSFYRLPFVRRWLVVREVKRLFDRLRGSPGEGALRGLAAGASAAVLAAAPGCTCGPGVTDAVTPGTDALSGTDAVPGTDAGADGGEAGTDAAPPGTDAAGGAGVFAPPVENPFGLTASAASYFMSPSLADLDADGDVDLLAIDDYGTPYFFENTGTATAPAFAAPVSAPFGLVMTYEILPVLVDLDADGDYDLLTAGSDPVTGMWGIAFHENTGTPAAPAFGASQVLPFGIAPGGYYPLLPAAADLDGDGDFDLLMNHYEASTATTVWRYQQNVGSAAAPAFAAATNDPFGLSSGLYYQLFPAMADVDLDGDVDLLAGAYYGAFIYYENTGTAPAAAFGMSGPNPLGLVSVGTYAALPAFGDLDADGDPDLLVGHDPTPGGPVPGFAYFENTTN